LGLGFLDVELSEELNVSGGGDRIISAPNSRVKVMVIQANEEVVVARRAVLALSA
jgi:acetate kinase